MFDVAAVNEAIAKRRKALMREAVVSVELYSKWKVHQDLPPWESLLKNLDEKIESSRKAIRELRQGDHVGLERTDAPIRIEHRTTDKLRYSPATGAYFGRPGEVDEEFGHIVVKRVIRTGSSIFRYPSSDWLLVDLGVIELPQKDLQRKYGRSIRTLDDLVENAAELSNPDVMYSELQKRAVRIVRRAFKPDVVHFTQEDGLVPNQYVVLNLDALMTDPSSPETRVAA